MPVRNRELVTPPPSLAGLRLLSGPALIAMLLASAIAVLDGLETRRPDRGEPGPAAVKRHGGEPRDDIAVLVQHRNGAR